MDLSSLVLAGVGLLVGGALGALFMRMSTIGRIATASAERDAARQERDAARAEANSEASRHEQTRHELHQANTELAQMEERLRHAHHSSEEKLQMLRNEQQKLAQEFERLSTAALRQTQDEFLKFANEKLKSSEERAKAELDQRRTVVETLVKPLNEQLEKVASHVTSLEKARAEAHAELRTHLQTVNQRSDELRTETRQLVTALRSPHVRGRWGEFQLRRVVEAAGMVEHVDFVEQESTDTAEGKLRPDMVVHLADGKRIVIDAKVAFSGFLEAQEARDDATRAARLAAHARHVKDHIDALSGKQYWEQFAPTPEFVVMFVPSDVFLNAALEENPTLYEHAFERNVVLATPATLVALLRTVSYTWRQEALAENAQHVLTLGRELHSRLATMGKHLGKLGRQLDGAVGAYNRTVSSLESRVLVTARKMVDLKVVDDELEAVPQVEAASRQLQAPELLTALDGENNAGDVLEVGGHRGHDGDLSRDGFSGDAVPDGGFDGRYGIDAPVASDEDEQAG